MDKLSGEERQDSDKVDRALSYFDGLRVEKDEEVSGMQLRKNQENYYEFCRELLPNVVGRNRFKAWVKAKPFMEVVTKSDEAFALLCMNNVLDLCKETVWAGDNKVISGKKGTKYTRSGKDVSTSLHCGWTPEGIRHFNKLGEAVEVDQKARGAEFDEFYKQKEKERMIGEYESRRTKKGAGRATTDLAIADIPFNDFKEIEKTWV